MKNIAYKVTGWVSNYGMITLFCLFLILEGVGKFSQYSSIEIMTPIMIKGFVLIICFSLILITTKKWNEFLYLLILSSIFIIGQASTEPSFSLNSLIICGKFLSPIVLFLLFSKFSLSRIYSRKTFQLFELILLSNSFLIVLGFAFDFDLFGTYSGERFGFSGIFQSAGVASYSYIITLSYFVVSYKKDVIRNWKFLFIFFTSFLVGTKALYLGLLVLTIYIISLHKSKFRKAFLVSIVVLAAIFTYLFLFKFGLFNELRQSQGLISSILSLRDQLYFQYTLPYIKENWSLINYLFGGVSNFDLRSQMEMVDVFFFWGIIGGILYVFTFLWSFITFKIDRTVALVGFMIAAIVFLAGNFFAYVIISVFLLVLRARILDYQSGNLKPRVLFFANIPIQNEERSIGGATVLAKQILDFVQLEERIELSHVQIRHFWRNKLQILDYFVWVFKFPFYIIKKDVVSFHGTKDYHFTIAPILWLWARIWRKRIVYHFFGGEFHEQFESSPRIIRYVFRNTILKSDTVFFETIEMVDYFKKNGVKNIAWLPNSRPPVSNVVVRKEYKKRFVFISRVIPQKGINEIIEAANNLSDEFIIDVFGPIDDRHYKDELFKGSLANYRGVLNVEEVLPTLSNYDVLLLPSYFIGEGYPGIVIEALSLAIPAITTSWKALPEIITNKYNGILITPKDASELEKAMLHFNTDNYSEFSRNALASFVNFNSSIVFNKFVESYTQYSSDQSSF